VILSATTNTHCDPATAFAFIAEGENNGRFEREVTSIRRLTDGPTRVGTRYAVTRRFWGISTTAEVEVATLEPPRRYVQVSRLGPVPVSGMIEIDEVDGRTRIASTLSVETRGFGRLLNPLFRRILTPPHRANAATLGRLLDEVANRHGDMS